MRSLGIIRARHLDQWLSRYFSLDPSSGQTEYNLFYVYEQTTSTAVGPLREERKKTHQENEMKKENE